MADSLSSALPGPAVGVGVGVPAEAVGEGVGVPAWAVGDGTGVPAGAVGAGVGVPLLGAAHAGSPLSTLYSRVNVRLYGTQPVKLFRWSHSLSKVSLFRFSGICPLRLLFETNSPGQVRQVAHLGRNGACQLIGVQP